MNKNKLKLICVIEGGLPSFFVNQEDVSCIDITVLDRDNAETVELDQKQVQKIEDQLAKMQEIGFDQPDEVEFQE